MSNFNAVNCQDGYVIIEESLSKEELEVMTNTVEWLEYIKKIYGRHYPSVISVKRGDRYEHFTWYPEKHGAKMDWRFYAGYDDIEAKDIINETNSSKRVALLKECLIDKYFLALKALVKKDFITCKYIYI